MAFWLNTDAADCQKGILFAVKASNTTQMNVKN